MNALPAAKLKTDWQAVERDYRTGQYTLRELESKHGVNNTTIMRRAAKEKWPQDLSVAIRQATNAMLIAAAVEVRRKETQQITQQDVQQAQQDAQQDAANMVFAAADGQVKVIKRQHVRLESLNDLYAATLSIANRVILVDDTQEGATPADPAAALAAIASLSQTARNLIDMERKVHKLDDAPPEASQTNVAATRVDINFGNAIDIIEAMEAKRLQGLGGVTDIEAKG